MHGQKNIKLLKNVFISCPISAHLCLYTYLHAKIKTGVVDFHVFDTERLY